MNFQILFKLLHTLEKLRQHERWTRGQLEAYQSESLHRLRTHAYAHSPFYQQFHKGLTSRPLHELPVLTKAMVMEHFDELVTDRAIHLADVRAHAEDDREGRRFLNRYWVTATSGSSGQPGFFLFDENEWAYIMASFARSQEWSGIHVNLTQRTRMATVASISPWHMSSQVAATAKSWWRPSLRLPASQPLPQTVQQLNEWQPAVLIAYASMAGIFADEQLAGRLRISPKVVYTSSEVLTTQTRKRVREAWAMSHSISTPQLKRLVSRQSIKPADGCTCSRIWSLLRSWTSTTVLCHLASTVRRCSSPHYSVTHSR